MKANMVSLHTPTTPVMGSKGHFFFFSKSGHVAYHIKVAEVWTYMQSNTLNLHTSLTSGDGFKGQILKLCSHLQLRPLPRNSRDVDFFTLQI